MDPILEELPNTHTILEYNRGVETTSRSASIAVDIFFALGWILSRSLYNFKYRKNYFLSKPGLEQLENALLNKGFQQKNFLRLIDKSSHDLFFLSKIFEFIFKRSKAKLLMLTDWYSTTNTAAILASKRLKMSSIDIQHGVQGEYHIAYGGWSGLEAAHQTLLPTHFWVWQKSDQVAIRNCTGKGSNVIWGSIPFLAKFQDLAPRLPDSIKLQYEQLKTLILESQKKTLLVTLQSGYETLPVILDFIKRNKSNFYFLFRLHHSSAISASQFIRIIEEKCDIEKGEFNIS
ncbi:MAG TPA: hypothetical protein VN132_08715, partial [Bdellovibrio sp.]|nr:hypothetical protein [Bdellovibrio sp.]